MARDSLSQGLRANKVDKYELVRRLATDVDGLPAARRSNALRPCARGSADAARTVTSEADKAVQVTQRWQ